MNAPPASRPPYASVAGAAAGVARGSERGSLLVEALAAMALTLAAGVVLAAAAVAGLGAARQAGVIHRAVALAARDLSALQSAGAPEVDETIALDDPALGPGAARRAVVHRGANDLAELTVAVAPAPPYAPVTLVTRMRLPL